MEELGFDYVGVAQDYRFIVSKENKDLFGFDEEKPINNNDISSKLASFQNYTHLYIHVDQIKNEENYYNGRPSDIMHMHITS